MDDNKEQKYLMFFLKEEYYGLPILNVNEIIGLMKITEIPQSPPFLKGVINLRGKIIPIMDLRLRFEMEEKAYDEQTCIIIVETEINSRKTSIGLLVDKVAEVVNVYESNIEAPPDLGQNSDSKLLTGIGKVKDKVVMLLDIQTIINCDGLSLLIEKNSNLVENAY